VPFGADIIGDKAKSAFGRRRARFGQRIGQEDADPWWACKAPIAWRSRNAPLRKGQREVQIQTVLLTGAQGS